MSEETKKCPFCAEEILVDAIKCKHCGSELHQAQEIAAIAQKPAADYGMFLLAIPVVGAMLTIFWVGNMSLIQFPSDKLQLIAVATVLGTAIVAAMEASKVGMKTDRAKRTNGPTSWFFMIVILWLLCYPMYLYKRRHYGLPSRLLGGIIVACLYIGCSLLVFSLIESQKAEVMGQFQQLQRDLQSLQ